MCTNTPDAASAPPPWLDRGRIPSLDGVRALAILLVLFAHWHFPGDAFGPVAAVKGRAGFLGVQLFFILSGFLVTTLMLREASRDGRLNLLGFYRRRALRILPAYAAFLAVLLIFQLTGAWRLAGKDWLALLTYTVNFPVGSMPWQTSHVWSLSVEEHFYLLWPLVFCTLPLIACRRAAALAVVAAFALRWVALAAWPGAAIDLWTPTRMDDLAAGCLLAFAAREASSHRWLDRVAGSTLLMGCVLATFAVGQVVLSRAVGGRLLGGSLVPPLVALANTVNAATLVLLLWWAVNRPEGRPGRWLNSRLAAGLGAISYGLYLWHPLFMPPAGASYALSFPLNLALAFATAVVSYYLIERPFLLIKDRGRPAERARQVVVPEERGETAIPLQGMVRVA